MSKDPTSQNGAQMTDIIARVKQLEAERNLAEKGHLSSVLAVEEESPVFMLTVMQAIAAETYEFTAQVHMYNRSWIYMWSPTSGNSVYGKWHPTRELAEKFAEQWQLDYPVRIVRRRVSPVEVVND